MKVFFQRSLFLFFTLILFSCHAQQPIKKSKKTETVKGKKFYIHTIEKGETLYSLSKAYEVSGNEIVVENPELIDGLKPGMKVRIPFKDESKKVNTDPSAFTGPVHVVVKGETMYSLCKKYDVRPEELVQLNPELKDGLKLGQIVRLPDRFEKPRPTAKADTLVQKPFVKDTGDYKVALLLPLFTSLNTDDKEYKDDNEKSTICPKSEIGVSFYEGAMMAIDSLRRLGLSVAVFTYDTENDSLLVEKIIQKPELEEMDLIIGPLYTNNFKRVSDFAKKEQIPLVSPFSQVNKILLGNPYIFKATPSLASQIDELASFVNKNASGKTIVLVSSDIPREKNYTEAFKKKFYALAKTDSILEVSFKKAGVVPIEASLAKGKEVWVIALTNDQVTVTDLVNKLNTIKQESIRLFGLETWTTFENLDPDYLMKLKVSICSPQYVNYDSPVVKRFIGQYRDKFRTDPDRYAFQAFDVTYYFLKRLKQDGRNFSEVSTPQEAGFQTSFNFFKTAVESGYENKFIHVLEYRNYRLEKLNQ